MLSSHMHFYEIATTESTDGVIVCNDGVVERGNGKEKGGRLKHERDCPCMLQKA